MRTRSEERRDDLNRLVSEAVARGIIDGGQRDKLQAFAAPFTTMVTGVVRPQ